MKSCAQNHSPYLYVPSLVAVARCAFSTKPCNLIVVPSTTPPISRAAKKQKTVELPKLPNISDALDGTIVQTLATVCQKIYDPALFTVFEPKDGEPDDQLNQSYEVVTKSGAYKEGGVYSADDSSYTGGEGALVSGYDIFNKDTTQVVEGKKCGSQSLAEYGTVIDGFTDFHGEAWTPPFAALIVQPKDAPEAVRTLP